MLVLDLTTARRLAIICQYLDGHGLAADKAGILTVVRQIGCLQLDPINVVARSPLLVLWSRLGPYDVTDLTDLLWHDRALFEYWAHAASIVVTEDYPLYQTRMLAYATGDAKWEKKVRHWIATNQSLRSSILGQLDEQGPLYTDQLHCPPGVLPWQSGGWTDSQSVSVMLSFLWEMGEIMVARRQGDGFGLNKQWTLTDRHLPQWAGHGRWSDREVVTEAAQRSLRALGVATAEHIKSHFIRGRYPGLAQVLEELEDAGKIVKVELVEEGSSIPGSWYMHNEDLPIVERLTAGDWRPRTTLLSPFDNLICDRDRTETLFKFSYRSEIYTPKAKRKYGYYVMPLLVGDQLVARIDPKLDRKTGTLHVISVAVEPGALVPAGALQEAVEQLASFLKARQIVYEPQGKTP